MTWSYPAAFVRAIDGDTVALAVTLPPFGVTVERVYRVAGVDTPERGQPGYWEAKAFTHLWCADRAGRLYVQIARRPDKYGRLVADVRAVAATMFTGEDDLATALTDAGHSVSP